MDGVWLKTGVGMCFCCLISKLYFLIQKDKSVYVLNENQVSLIIKKPN